MNRGIACALAAAALFGASTPLAKRLVGDIDPLILAGLLYLGSGVGLGVLLCVRRLTTRRPFELALPAGTEWIWLGGAIVAGGIFAPVLLMYGLTMTSAASASLLLNLEAVLTALVAWFVFRENFDRRIAVGMACIVAGGILLSWSPEVRGPDRGALLVSAACAAWAIDNNLTRRVAAADAVVLAGLKGLIAGGTTLAYALAVGHELPPLALVPGVALVGFLGYGVSLVLFVLALRHLGTARTGAYFSVAPFFGAALALLLEHDAVNVQLAGAAALMGLGVWLHISERHEHKHAHEAREHAHSHRHDDHHRHAHAESWDGHEPHAHAHVHEAVVHKHPHYPDMHHRHPH